MMHFFVMNRCQLVGILPPTAVIAFHAFLRYFRAKGEKCSFFVNELYFVITFTPSYTWGVGPIGVILGPLQTFATFELSTALFNPDTMQYKYSYCVAGHTIRSIKIFLSGKKFVLLPLQILKFHSNALHKQ